MFANVSLCPKLPIDNMLHSIQVHPSWLVYADAFHCHFYVWHLSVQYGQT